MARSSVTMFFLTFLLNVALVHGSDSGTGCVQGCQQNLVCNCAANQRCELQQQTCTACAKMICHDMLGKPEKNVSPGAIAGGVLGGFIVVCIAGFFAYRAWAKKRRTAAERASEKGNDLGAFKSARASTHTVASIASTVRTQASNIIQIAYIPGVTTNRSGPPTPGHHVPPVHPITYTDSPQDSQFPRTPNGDIQFAAEDLLRSSMYTVDPRASVATTIYGGNAVVQQPNIIRAGKAAVVTVKSSAPVSVTNSPSDDGVPAVPPLFSDNGGPEIEAMANTNTRALIDGRTPSPAFSIGSTFIGRMNAKVESSSDAAMPQPLMIPGRSFAPENHISSPLGYETDDTEDFTPGHRGNRGQSQCSSCVTDIETDSPFSDAHDMTLKNIPLPHGAGMPPKGTSRGLSMNIAGGRASKQSNLPTMHEGRAVSPFDDSHTIDER